MPRPPNILFFFPDQHRPDWLGCNPDLPLRTPNLDGLCSRGVRFVSAWTPSPLCAPARACVASGRAYDRCGVPGNETNYPLDQPTYYQALRDAGYRVAGVGKFDLHKDTGDPTRLDWHLDGSRNLSAWGFTEGIDNEGKFDGSTSYRVNGEPRGPYLAHLHRLGLAESYVQEHGSAEQHMGAYTTCLPDEAYCDNWLSENGLRFLQAFPQRTPWHLVVNFTGPHNPMDVTASMRQRWEGVDFPPPHGNVEPDRQGLLRNRQNYAAMIENIDRQVGRFLEAVADRGELDNTLVVYSSDHGEMLGDCGRWGKSTWRTPASSVPLIVSGPAVAGGRVSDALVCLQDLTASFVDYGGCAPLPEMDGRSLRPLLEGAAADVGHRDVAVSGLHDWRLAVDGTHKLVSRRDEPDLLFDLGDDPWEERDLAADCPGARTELRERLAQEIPDWDGGRDER